MSALDHLPRPSLRTLTAVGVVLAVIALPLRGLLRYQGPPMEEGFMLAFPQEVLRGQLPNRDFLHLYGPGSLWALAGIFKVFGTSLATERFVGLAQHLGVVFGIFCLARPWGRAVAVVAALTSLFIIVPPVGLTAMAWNGAVAFGLWSLVAGLAARRGEGTSRWTGGADRVLVLAGGAAEDRRYADRHLIACGALAGIALLYRPDLVVAMSLGLLSIVWRQDRRARTRVAAGLSVGLVGYLVQFATAGPGHSIQGMVLDPVFRLRPGRTLPVPPPWDHLNGFLQKAAGLRVIGWPVAHLAPSHEVFLWFFLVPLSALFVAAVGWRARRRDPGSFRAQVLLTCGLFSVGLLTQSLQRPDTAHFAWVSCVSVALVPVAVAELVGTTRFARSRVLAPSAAFTTAAVVLVAVIPLFTVRTYIDLSEQTFGRNVQGYPISNRGRNFYYGSAADAAAANEVVRALDRIAVPGRRLLVGPTDLRRTPYSDAFFYFLFPQLRVGTYYIEMDPWMANRPGSGLAHEVATADYLILSDVWSNWVEPNASRRFGPNEPNQVVAQRFCLVGSYGAEAAHPHGIFRLYRRCH